MNAVMSGIEPTAADLKELEKSSQKAADLLKTLANRERLLLVCNMLQGEPCVSDLEEMTGIVQPTLSQQLGVLRRQGLVAVRRDGKHIHYSIKDPAAIRLLETLHSIFCPAPRRRARKA